MSDLNCIAQTAEVALTAATAKTVLQIVAPANQRLKVKRWGVFFDGVNAAAEPAQVRLLRQTTAGTMSALTPTKQDTHAETVQSTAQHTATSEPTAGDVVDMVECHTQTGYEVILTQETYIKVGGGGRLGIEITAPAGVNVRAKMVYEE